MRRLRAAGWALVFGGIAVFFLWLAWHCVKAALTVSGGFAVFAAVVVVAAVLAVASGAVMVIKTLRED
jgi:hypothetical protein